MSVRVLREARREAIEAADWYDGKRFGLGVEFLDAVERSFARIEESRNSFSKWIPYRGDRDIRYCRVHRFPYVVIFATAPEDAVVVAISHVHRHPLYWVARLGEWEYDERFES